VTFDLLPEKRARRAGAGDVEVVTDTGHDETAASPVASVSADHHGRRGRDSDNGDRLELAPFMPCMVPTWTASFLELTDSETVGKPTALSAARARFGGIGSGGEGLLFK